ncbi:hypothetical protein [Metabacillus sp. Hm71]|uniref:hypothetical protein n=1 Tax=Metabacillus sp. Hm71 TaxID=3450743 RepID=UPI003F4252BD
MATMNQYTPKYFGNATDIAAAKARGVQGEFFDTTKSNQGALIQTIRNAYDRGHNPVLLGGANAAGGITQSLENRLKATGYNNISRISGANRTDTQQALSRFDTNNKINQMYDKQSQAYKDQAKDLAPQYQQKRNQADVVNMQNVQKLREIMAANGLSGSGENVTAQVGLNAQRQNSLNDINIAEQAARNEINRKALELEAQRIQALMENQRYLDQQDYQIDRDQVEDARYRQQFEYQQQQDNRNFNWQKQQYAQEKAWREYTYKNMSANEKATLDWAKSQYGEDAAWRMFELQYNGNLQKSMNDAQIDLYRNSGFLMP